MASDAETPVVSFVVPTYREAEYLPATLESIRAQETSVPCEVVVVDGGSDDGTVELARSYGATVLEQTGEGIGQARTQGAGHADGDWVAFVDADTTLDPGYVDEMLSFVREHDLVAATSRCRLTGPRRARVPEFVVNHVFPRMTRPVLPGFNTFVERDALEAVGGVPEVPNEDKAFSRRLAAVGDTDYLSEPLVENSGRRVADQGLVGTLLHYLRLDAAAALSDGGTDHLGPRHLAAVAVALCLGVLQFVHATVFDHPQAALAGVGYFGGVALFMLDVDRPEVVGYGTAFVGFQVGWWIHQGTDHGTFGAGLAALQVALLAGFGLLLSWPRLDRWESRVAAVFRSPWE